MDWPVQRRFRAITMMPFMALRLFLVAPIALLTDVKPHGDGLVAFGFIRELAARGHDLQVAAHRVDLRGELPPNVELHVLDPRGAPAPLDRLGFMWRLRRLYRRLERRAPFAAVHQLNPVDVGLSLALTDLRAPLVLGPYVPDWPGFPKPGGRLARPAVVRVNRMIRAAQQRRATTLLLSTPAAASRLAIDPSPGVHVREISPGIDDRAWVPGGETAGQDVLFLANLEVRKGIHLALDAFERLVPRLPGARLIVAGRGPELEAVQRRIRSTPALERVELLGHLPREQVMARMQNSDVYCLPSYDEPFGMTALEAMACAKPVVATAAGGLAHLVPDEGGRKVPPGDPAALADALYEVLANPRLRQAMGRHNRQVVEQRYAWARVVDRLEEAYEEAMRDPRRAGSVKSR
jgi:glycosyltransferase involved in cell wall biosynthesis